VAGTYSRREKDEKYFNIFRKNCLKVIDPLRDLDRDESITLNGLLSTSGSLDSGWDSVKMAVNLQISGARG
jgi:hypothetical protein